MRVLRLALAAGLSLLIVTGCGSASDTKNSADPSSPTQDSTSPTEATTESEAPTASPTEGTESTQTGGDVVTGEGYLVSLPATWQDVTDVALQSNPQADVALAEPMQAGKFRTNFNVVKPNPIAETVTEEQLATQAAKELKSVTHHKVARMPGPDFDGTSSLSQSSQTSTSGLKVTLIQYIVVHEGKVYATTMTFESKRTHEATSALDDIVTSWAWQS